MLAGTFVIFLLFSVPKNLANSALANALLRSTSPGLCVDFYFAHPLFFVALATLCHIDDGRSIAPTSVYRSMAKDQSISARLAIDFFFREAAEY